MYGGEGNVYGGEGNMYGGKEVCVAGKGTCMLWGKVLRVASRYGPLHEMSGLCGCPSDSFIWPAVVASILHQRKGSGITL